jgi:crotonobetainyl-CoA:carnitine CoA-transferase CaiB-like acyl-CoA transferase
MAGIISARETGKGQVIDCAMSDGAASLMAMFYGFKGAGIWKDERRSNLLDGGAHFYDTYQCADGKWISIGSIEPQFYALLLEKTGITDPEFANQMDRSAWPSLKPPNTPTTWPAKPSSPSRAWSSRPPRRASRPRRAPSRARRRRSAPTTTRP